MDLSENDIPWAAIGAFLLGLGSTLSGWAAIITAKRVGHTAVKEQKDEKHPESGDAGGIRVIDGGGERISDSDGPESSSSGPT